MCALCVENGGQQRYETLQVKMHDLILQNPVLIPYLINLNIEPEQLLSRESLFALKDKFKVTEAKREIDRLVYNGKLVLNQGTTGPRGSKDVLSIMKELVMSGKVDTESCLICYGDFIHHDLTPICYRKECKAHGCAACIKNWFSENAPGKRVLENRLTCPMCKQIPIGGFAFTNPYLRALTSQNMIFDHDWHYAWCKVCKKIKEYMARQCAGPDPMEVTDFTCEDCMKPGVFKACPFCALPTVKMSGCDHMECPKSHGGCGIHWCYRCEGPDIFHSANGQDVYNHLHDHHGNIWGAIDEGDDEEGGEEYEE
jgi:hypothetical protein